MLRSGWAGLAICAAGAALVVASAAAQPGSRPGPVLALLAAVAAAGVAGRLVSAAGRWVAPATVVAATSVAVVPFLPDAGSPLAAPLGYANADGTLFAIGALAGLALATDVRSPYAARAAGVGGAVWLGVATVATDSAGSVAVLAGGAAVGLVARRRPRTAAVAAGAGLALLLVVTVGVGAASGDADVDGGGGATRAALWHDALDLAVEHPGTGVGPGRFEDERTVTDDPDLRFAHHGPLQATAELGVGGLALLLAAVAWALARAGASRGAPAVAALATTTALAAHSCFDYVLHEGVLAVAVAFLVGNCRRSWGLWPPRPPAIRLRTGSRG